MLLTVAGACALCLSWLSCGSRPATYQVARSDDGRCVFEITEYDDPEGDIPYRLLDLCIVLDGREVLRRSYLGTKRWGGTTRQFAVGRAGPFYCLSVVGYQEYAVAVTDGGTGVVWFQATDQTSEYIERTFAADPAMPRLTDLNSMNAFVFTPHP
jgi:hypothetical protein